MPLVTLRPITASNWKDCTALLVHESQIEFVPSNLYSIAESQFYPEARSLGIYSANQIVGYVLYGRDNFTGSWKIFRLMIDKSAQNRGYGRAALEQVITEIAGYPDANEILICYHNTNEVARKLYASVGFMEFNVDVDGKATARLIVRVSSLSNSI
jgi:diamine N-acetyltransferase